MLEQKMTPKERQAALQTAIDAFISARCGGSIKAFVQVNRKNRTLVRLRRIIPTPSEGGEGSPAGHA